MDLYNVFDYSKISFKMMLKARVIARFAKLIVSQIIFYSFSWSILILTSHITENIGHFLSHPTFKVE